MNNRPASVNLIRFFQSENMNKHAGSLLFMINSRYQVRLGIYGLGLWFFYVGLTYLLNLKFKYIYEYYHLLFFDNNYHCH